MRNSISKRLVIKLAETPKEKERVLQFTQAKHQKKRTTSDEARLVHGMPVNIMVLSGESDCLECGLELLGSVGLCGPDRAGHVPDDYLFEIGPIGRSIPIWKLFEASHAGGVWALDRLACTDSITDEFLRGVIMNSLLLGVTQFARLQFVEYFSIHAHRRMRQILEFLGVTIVEMNYPLSQKYSPSRFTESLTRGDAIVLTIIKIFSLRDIVFNVRNKLEEAFPKYEIFSKVPKSLVSSERASKTLLE
ncbi:hypothetical protein KKC60_01030 [Patescibacteria group bacterium]|nr:hypothetical protein [Patescibacteria group bacterium]